MGYRNMYHQRRKYLVRSSNIALVSVATPEVAVPALEQRNLGLRVDATRACAGTQDVLVFVNDEDDRNEDCYRVRVHICPPDT